MLSRASLIWTVAVAAVAGGMPPRLAAQVAAKSPFMPAAGPNAAAAPTAGAPLEFRGFMDVGDGVQFRLFDPAKKAGAWVKLNERSAEFEVVAKQHDESQKTLTIEHQGRTLILAMRESKVVSAGSAAQFVPPPPMPTPAPPSNVAPAVTQSVVLNPTPADEQRRLEAVAAEVARRRAMREQATQQIGQGAMPPQTPPGLNPGANRPPGLPTNQAR
jgi:hypothetical protein